MKRLIAITLDSKLVEEIDANRGLVPRSTFIDSQLKKLLEEEDASFRK